MLEIFHILQQSPSGMCMSCVYLLGVCLCVVCECALYIYIYICVQTFVSRDLLQRQVTVN